MAEAKSLSKVETIMEQIHEHISYHSWLNITNFNNWVMDLTDNQEATIDYYDNPRYFLAVECETADNAKAVLAYFKELGVPDNDEEPYSPEGPTTNVYLFKKMI